MIKKVIVSALILIAIAIFPPIALTNISEENVSAPFPLETEVVNQISLSGGETEGQRSPELFVYVSLIIMSIATLFSVIISYYLYRWRRILLAKPNLLVPEEWGKYLGGVGKNMEILGTSFTNNINNIANKTSENSEKITSMIEIYMSLQKSWMKKTLKFVA